MATGLMAWCYHRLRQGDFACLGAATVNIAAVVLSGSPMLETRVTDPAFRARYLSDPDQPASPLPGPEKAAGAHPRITSR